MRKSIVATLGTVMLVSALALSACGGSKKTDVGTQNAEANSQAEDTASQTAETTVVLGESKLNFDIADAIDGDYDTLVKANGTPTADTGETGDIRTLTIGNRQFILYNTENDYHGMSCFRVISTAGDIYALAADKLSVEDFEKSIEIEGDATVTDAITEGNYAIGTTGDKILAYTAAEGYDIQIVLDADGGVSKDCKAAMSVIPDEEEESDASEEESDTAEEE